MSCVITTNLILLLLFRTFGTFGAYGAKGAVGAFGAFGSYMNIQAEFELRKHNHGATGLGAFRPWPGSIDNC